MATPAAREAAIVLLAELASTCVMIVDSDRAVDIVEAFLRVQQEVVREGTARDVVERIEARAASAASPTTEAWGRAVALHIGRAYGVRPVAPADGRAG